MKAETRYLKNLERFARDNPIDAIRLDAVDCSALRFCRTYHGELNLVDEGGGTPFYVHAQEGAMAEAESWVGIQPLDAVDVLFVFGIGLGYYYLPLKQWLRADRNRYLVFLEDDARVIRLFLGTDLATEIFNDQQVIIKQIPKVEANERGWCELRKATFILTSTFCLQKTHLTCLQSYFFSRFDFFNALVFQWSVNLASLAKDLRASLLCPLPKMQNFYANLPYISGAILGYKLEDALRGIPAILCGAGPSLEKQLAKIDKLEDKALIIASGSAINALTSASIFPHVAGAIDPTAAQASRLLTSFAIDVPAFYQNSFYPKALAQWHGPLIYMNRDKDDYVFFHWFERELGIGEAEPILAGVSTSNFLVEVAGYLDCNPIIMAGMDLAYTRDSRYAQGVLAHPTDDSIQKIALGAKQDVIAVDGVGGKEVYTTLQWINEAGCLIDFKERHPGTVFLNATEGGMPISSVANTTFSEAVEEYLHLSMDIQGWVHGVIQNSADEMIPEGRVLETIGKWHQSLDNCLVNLDGLTVALKENQKRVRHKEKLSSGAYSGRAALWQAKLFGEVAYTQCLHIIEEGFEGTNALQRRNINDLSNQGRKTLASIAMELDRCDYLRRHALQHLHDIRVGMKAYFEHRKALADKVEHPLCISESQGEVENEHGFTPTLIPVGMLPKPAQKPAVEALVGMVEGEREGQTLYFYPQGSIKVEAFYLHGKLHGPWKFYSEKGILLFRSRYVEGVKQGKSKAYYHSGELYSVQGFVEGKREGEHRYYYPDGILKTMASYKNGKLDGVIRLYYSNGRPKKEQYFIDGKLHGKERLWNVFGTLVVETDYENSSPVGVSRRWHDNGKLAYEIEHKLNVIREWDENGRALHENRP